MFHFRELNFFNLNLILKRFLIFLNLKALDKQIYENWIYFLPKAIDYFKNLSYQMKLERFLSVQYTKMKPHLENK
jgi:hypothetical protein